LNLDHSADDFVDVVFSVTPITTVVEGVSLVDVSTSGGGKLEGPDGVVGLLEVGADGEDFFNKIFNTQDVVLGEGSRNNLVGSDGDSLLVDLKVTSLVEQLGDGLSVRVTVGDIRVDVLKHVKGGLVYSNESGVVDLSKSEESEDSLRSGVDVVDTSDSDNKEKLGFSRDKEGVAGSGLSS